MRFPRNGVSFAAAVGAVALASCSGGGGAPSVTYSPAPNFPSASPNATSTATTVAVTTSSSPTSGATTTPTSGASTTPSTGPSTTASTSPSTTPSTSPSSAPSTAPTTAPTATAVATVAPTATATSGGGTSTAQCSSYAMMNASSSPPATATITEALPQNGGTIPLPNYEDFTGSSNTIAYTSSAQSNVTITLGFTNDDGVTVPSGQTSVAFSSLQLDQTATFAQQQSTVVTSTSPCNFVTGSTYYYTVYALGTTTQATAQVDSFNASTNTITFHLSVPGTGPTYTFPANTKADIVISKTTP